MRKIIPIVATGIITAGTVFYNVAPFASADKTSTMDKVVAENTNLQADGTTEKAVEKKAENDTEKIRADLSDKDKSLKEKSLSENTATADNNADDQNFPDTPNVEQKVKHIIVEGNTTLKEEDILKLVTNTQVDSVYSKDIVKKDLEAIAGAGIVQSVKARAVQNNGDLYIVFEVEELSEIKSIQITGNTLVDTEEISNALVSKAGEQFNKETVEKDIENIKALYSDKGYMAIVSEVNNDNGDVKYTIAEARIESVVYEGNTKTKEWVLDKITGKRLKKGEFLTTKALQNVYKDLAVTGFFKDVHINADEGSSKGNVVLKIKVTEDKSGEWNLGGGYSDSYKAEIVGGIRDKNLNGEAKSIGYDFGFGKDRNHFSLTYYDPYWKKSDTAVYGKIFKSQKDVDNAYAKYTEKHTGGTIGFSKPISADNKTKMHANFTADKIEADNKSGHHINDLQDNHITVGVVHDSREEDQISGTVVEGAMTVSHSIFGSGSDYTKFMAGVKNYVELSAKNVLASRLQVNYSPDNLPDVAQFSIGGADSVRGLDEDAQKGNKSVLASLELRHQMSKTVQGVVFVDAGKAWSDAVENSLKVAAGIGLRINTAMGMLRLDIANAGEGMKYMFGIGQSF
ncbi:BamA/OMP85 family outer membrane protein [Selenomonas montiformis]|uniref:BamA/OMP85 family outer membrane protein n=1 Tax=Selenomonas montiformis TaxID=2652285 RepID=UPI003F89FDD0